MKGSLSGRWAAFISMFGGYSTDELYIFTTGIVTNKTESVKTVSFHDEVGGTSYTELVTHCLECTFEHDSIKYTKVFKSSDCNYKYDTYHMVMSEGDEIPIKFLKNNAKNALFNYDDFEISKEGIVSNKVVRSVNEQTRIKNYGHNYDEMPLFGNLDTILVDFRAVGEFDIFIIEYQFAANGIDYEMQCQVDSETFNKAEIGGRIPISFIKRYPERGVELIGNTKIGEHKLSDIDFLEKKTATVINKSKKSVTRKTIVNNFGQEEYELQLDDSDSIHRAFHFGGEFDIYNIEFQFEHNATNYTAQCQLSEKHYDQIALGEDIPIHFFESEPELALIVSEHPDINQLDLSGGG